MASSTYGKSPKGVNEIQTRAARLSPRLRSTLILLDGKRTLEQLHGLVGADLEANLQALVDGGFADPVPLPEAPRAAPRTPLPPPRSAGADSAAVAPVPERAAAAPTPTSRAPATLAEVRREIVRTLLDQVGPVAEPLAIRIERCASLAELRPLLASAAQLIEQVRGAGAAQAFSSRFAVA